MDTRGFMGSKGPCNSLRPIVVREVFFLAFFWAFCLQKNAIFSKICVFLKKILQGKLFFQKLAFFGIFLKTNASIIVYFCYTFSPILKPPKISFFKNWRFFWAFFFQVDVFFVKKNAQIKKVFFRILPPPHLWTILPPLPPPKIDP